MMKDAGNGGVPSMAQVMQNDPVMRAQQKRMEDMQKRIQEGDVFGKD